MLESVSGIDHFFSVQQLVFRCLSIDVTSVECKIRRPFFTCVGFVCSVIISLAMGKYGWENRDDVSKLLSALAPILQSFICAIKFLIILRKRKHMGKLLHSIWILTLESNTEELPIIAAENAKDFMFGLCFYISILALVVTILVIPILTTIWLFFKTEQLQIYHILRTSYPFDQNQPTYFIVTNCILVGGAYFGVHSIVATEILYLWLILNTAAQFRVLKLKLSKVALSHQDCEMGYALIRCIRRHQKILSIADEINNFFCRIIFAEVLKNCVLLSLIAYQLGNFHGMDLKNLAFLTSFFISASAQLTIYCYGGQRIQDESQHLSDFICETFSWDSITKRDKKLLMIFIARAQKCCQLSGFNFTVNWKLFLWVVRTNYSYISLLWSFDKKKAI